MSANYNDVIKRLIEERIRLSLSQNEMARIVHMTQSNYSKVELGFRRLSYNEVKGLGESGVDAYYIFTGYRNNFKYAEYLSKFSYYELISYLTIINSVLMLRKCEFSVEFWSDIIKRTKYISLIATEQTTQNIFYTIRYSMKCQQRKMAEELGVDIKKYRDLEKGRSLPDSELLWKVYDSFCVSPMVILKDKRGLINEISTVLEVVEKDAAIFEILERIKEKN